MGSALFFGIFALVCNLVGFSTPYWIEVWPRVSDTTFRRLGLWQVCIAGFRNPKNYWGKVYYGCWWLFAREYNGLRADEILTPPWFIAVQTFACFGLIFNMLCSAALVVVAITRYRLSRRSMLIGCILSACAWLCNFLTVLIFGIYADAIPGKWMPRPDYTFLSWSYIFTLASMISSLFAVGFVLFEIYFITEGKRNHNEKTFIRHVGNDDQAFVRHAEGDEPPFVRRVKDTDEPFVRRSDDENERAFIRRADNPYPDEAFIRRSDAPGQEAFIRRADPSKPGEASIRRTDDMSDREEPFIRRASNGNNPGTNFIV